MSAAAAPTIISPAPGATVASDAALSWGSVAGAAAYRIQLSAEPDFDFAYETIDTVATSFEPDLYFTPGTVYWRVAVLEAGAPGTWASASFDVVRTDVPVPSSPANGTVFAFPGPGPVLSWTPSFSGPYQVELDGPWGLGSYISDATRFALPQALPEGTWTWRVRPLVNNSGMPWSAARTFVVTWPDSDPVIDAPADGAAVESFHMDWQPIPGAARYEVQVSPAADFPQGSRTEVTTRVTELDLGRSPQNETRWWRVRGRNGQVIGPWSEGRSVTHAAWSAAPADLWPTSGTFDVAPTLRWSPIAEASRYEIEVAADPADLGANSQTCRSFVNAASFVRGPYFACDVLDFPTAGQVYWRVRGVDDPSGATTAWSSIAEFAYDPPAGGQPLADPVVATPIGPADCGDPGLCSHETQMALLTWEAVEGASFYRVQLDQRDAHLPGSTWDTPGTSFVPPLDAFGALDVPRFSWQVVACASEASCPAWTDASPDLRHFAIAPRPLVVSPSNGTAGTGEIELGFAMAAVEAPAEGEPWEIAQAPSNLWLQVDDEPSFDLPHLSSTAVDRPQSVFGALPAGEIHWRVSYGDPTDATGAVTRSFDWEFESTAIEPSDGTELDTPARVVWTHTQGAAAYGIEVDRDGWQPPLHNSGQQWTSGLIGEDFVPGPITWRVTPFDDLGNAGTPVGGTFVVAAKNPILTTPLDGASVSAVGAVFDWEAVDSTAGYRVDVSTTSDFASLVDSTWTQRTRYVPTIAYPAGQLWWRVRAESGYGQILGEVIGSSTPRQLTSVAVITPDTTPPVGAVSIAGGAAYTTSTTVTAATAATDSGSGLSQVALSNDGVAWTTRTYASSQAWTLTGGQGNKTVHVKWKDVAGNWSAPKSDTILLDSVAPAGTVSIAGRAAYAKTTAVTVATAATDAGSGVSQVALSNDGVAWTTRSYAPSQAWTLPATNGSRTVYAKWKDAAGNWSAAKGDTIVLDTVAPTATAPRRGLVAGTAIDAGRITLRVPWTGTDATSGIARYELLQSTDGGPWTTVSTTLPGPTADRSLAPLHSYRFRVRAVDRAGNVGAWAFGSTFRLARYSEFNRAVGYRGTWSTVSSEAYWGGAAKRSGTAGARASLTFTGRAVAWVARTGPNRGVATVYVNGTKVATIDLHSPSYRNQRVVWARNWSSSVERTVTIRVAGTSGRPLVDVDAFVTAN